MLRLICRNIDTAIAFMSCMVDNCACISGVCFIYFIAKYYVGSAVLVIISYLNHKLFGSNRICISQNQQDYCCNK